MATSTELFTEIASGETRLGELQSELRRAAGLQKSNLLREIVRIAMALDGLVHEEQAQGWSSES